MMLCPCRRLKSDRAAVKMYGMRRSGGCMTDMMSYGVMAGICGLVLMIGVLKSRAEFVLNFLVRMILGAICIVFLNNFFETQGG